MNKTFISSMHNEDEPDYTLHWITLSEARRRWGEKSEADHRRERNQQATINDLKRSCGVVPHS